VDGPGSATIFNGPTPLLDAMYTSANNLITGKRFNWWALLYHGQLQSWLHILHTCR